MSAVSRTTRPAGHVLVVNPNSDPEVTGRLRDAARRALPSGIRAEVANPAGGPFAIETDSQKAEAVPRVLDLVRERGFGRFGAIAMGCFDDLALEELRRLAPVPVVGTFEAGLLHVRSLSSRFAIVTTFEAALPGIAGLLRRYGAPDCVGIRAAGVGVAAAARSDDATTARIEAAVRAAIETDGAHAILLGSGGLTGWAPQLQERFRVPVVDGVESAIRIAGALAVSRSA